MWCAVKFSQYEIDNLDIMELEAMTYCIFLKMLIDRDPRLMVQGRRFTARATYGWTGQQSSSGFIHTARPTLGVFASLDRF
jgi:hypothetical protein